MLLGPHARTIVCLVFLLASPALSGKTEHDNERDLLRRQAIEAVTTSFERTKKGKQASTHILHGLGKVWAIALTGMLPEESLFEEQIFSSMRRELDSVTASGEMYKLSDRFDICFVTFCYPGTYQMKTAGKKSSMIEIDQASYLHLAHDFLPPSRLCVVRRYRESSTKVRATVAIKWSGQRKKDSVEGDILLYAVYALGRDGPLHSFEWKKVMSESVFVPVGAEKERRPEKGKRKGTLKAPVKAGKESREKSLKASLKEPKRKPKRA
ncbi:MAG: hypothetical protein JW888_02465 [Pirellulales bacterium]|nr:hypothetical protein [Pirellulales bacterium]